MNVMNGTCGIRIENKQTNLIVAKNFLPNAKDTDTSGILIIKELALCNVMFVMESYVISVLYNEQKY